MADEEKNKAEEAEAPAEKKSKKPMLFGGGIVAVLGLAYLAATMAVPSPKATRRFAGPFVVQLFDEKIHVNLDEEGKKRFLQMNFNVVYTAYDQAYVTARTSDPLYAPYVDDAIRRVSMLKKIDDVVGGKTRTALYLQEIRDALGPILFPVHIGETVKPADREEVSGIAPGLSIAHSTFRVPRDEGVLHVDGPAQTVRLGEGEPVAYLGNEEDLELADGQGRTVFLDVTGVNGEFVGEIPIGVDGTVREVLLKDLLIQ